jgi:cytochrome c oxidase cbb3-type subunit III
MEVQLFDSALSGFWNIWVMGLTTINLLLLVWLVVWTQKIPAGEAQSSEDTTGHEYDGIQELNSPLPRWWLWMLYIAIVFAIAYFILYPGFGNTKGVLGWSQEKQWADDVVAYNEKTAPVFARLTAMSVADIAKDEEGQRIGKRLFLNYCSVCHGTNAKGTTGFPNLTDNDWLYGGEPAQIETTILNGRGGVMPPYGGLPLNDEQLDNVGNYVLSLSGRGDAAKASKGKSNFALCSACHGSTGTGNIALGAPNLADSTWLHGKSLAAIKHNIKTGFDGQKNRMPAFKDFLGADKVKVLSGYIYSLSNK